MFADDRTRLLHMLDAARDAQEIASGCERPDLDSDKKLRYALIQCLLVVGEAAAHISLEFQHRHPEIEWRGAIGMRHRLVHGYAEVDLDVVWAVLRQDLPELLAQLEAARKAEGFHA